MTRAFPSGGGHPAKDVHNESCCSSLERHDHITVDAVISDNRNGYGGEGGGRSGGGCGGGVR